MIKDKIKPVILKNRQNGKTSKAVYYENDILGGRAYLRSNTRDAIHFTQAFIEKHFEILPCDEDVEQVWDNLG